MESPSLARQVQSRRGKAPPVIMFSGEDPELSLSDWLPSLKRVVQWNGWGLEELLIQLAGYLKGRALQEWNVLEEAERDSYDKAVVALRKRLDTGSKVMAAQDFHHLAQEEKEKVINFIRRLERTFRLAYGHNSMSAETRDALLFGQLQESLKYGPAVSGATSYQSLRMCIAAKSEEHRQAALKKRKQYQGDYPPSSRGPSRPPSKPPGPNQAKCYDPP